MTATLTLPTLAGGLEPFSFAPARSWPAPGADVAAVRTAYAAAHVVADPLRDNTPGAPAELDWDATLAYRHHLWTLGLGVADAMDTAQRGMGLTWSATAELVRRSGEEARGCGGALACGVGTDHLSPGDHGLEEVLHAYLEQLEVVEAAGAVPILMASRQLAAAARTPDGYLAVYGRLLEQVSTPAILHWLGPMFDPQLAGYWGKDDVEDAMTVVLELIRAHADRVDGIKVSLLEERHEVALRAALPDGVKMYTGDDFNYPQLVKGDSDAYSHALLGIFDPIAPVAATALEALAGGDLTTYDEVLAPTVPLSRHLFGEPTYFYKTGIVFLAWLNGHQPAFRMVGGLESARSVPHLCETVRLADRAGLISDPELAAGRLRSFLDVAGVPR